MDDLRVTPYSRKPPLISRMKKPKLNPNVKLEVANLPHLSYLLGYHLVQILCSKVPSGGDNLV